MSGGDAPQPFEQWSRLLSAADTIGALRLGRACRVEQAEVHLVAHPSETTLLSIEPRAGAPTSALVHGVGLDVIFPVRHGPYGEDGTVQGLLELANVAYVGAGVLASALGMDKVVMKVVFAAAGLPIVEYLSLRRREVIEASRAAAERVAARLSFPVFVKPANLGSSVGISKARTLAELETALHVAAEYDVKLIVEAAVPAAREIEVAVLGARDPEASVPGEVIPSREFYDYESKYVDEGSRLVIPADLTPELALSVRRLSVEAFRAIDCAGMARVDFLLSRDSRRLYVNEINTIPGFTTISMYAKLWEASGVTYPVLLDRLIALALERHAEKQALRTSVS